MFRVRDVSNSLCARSGVADDRPALERQQEAADAINHAVVNALRRLHCATNAPSRLWTGALRHNNTASRGRTADSHDCGMRHAALFSSSSDTRYRSSAQ
jgi:hypothetical protein